MSAAQESDTITIGKMILRLNDLRTRIKETDNK